MFHGCLTALVTPFRNGAVDMKALAALVDEQIAAGIDGLVPCGSTGESATLSHEEHEAVIREVIRVAAKRVPVIAGTGSNSTAEAIRLTKAAEAAGADGALLISPYYNKPTQEGLYRHFRAVADDGGLPVMLYHIPGRTAGAIEVETVARLWKAGGMFALKEAQGHVDRVTRLREACGIPILSGDDALTLPFVSLGAVGVVSVASNVVPAKVVAMVRDALAGRRAEALAAHEALTPLFRALFQETNPIPVKAALKLLGIFPSDEVRLPLVPASPAVLSALRAALGTPGS